MVEGHVPQGVEVQVLSSALNFMAALARFIPLSEAARRMRVSGKETHVMI